MNQPPYTIFSGVIGFTISVILGGYDLTGATAATLLCTDPNGNKQTFSMALQPDNRTVQLVTSGTEFPTIGNWQCNVKVVWGSTKLLISTPFTLTVLAPN